MPRIRSIKPELVYDERSAALSNDAFRTFTCLIAALCDDYGRFRAAPRWLELQIYWATECTVEFESVIKELHDARLIRLFDVRGQRFGMVRSWDKHQRVNNAGKFQTFDLEDADAIEVDAFGSPIAEKTLLSASPRESRRVPASLGLEDGCRRSEDEGRRSDQLPPEAPPQTEPESPPPTPKVADAPGDATAPSEQNHQTKTQRTKIQKAKRRQQISESWQPTRETIEVLCSELGFTRAQITDAVPAFVDFWVGEGQTKANWDATFRSRVRRWTADGKLKPERRRLDPRIAERTIEARKATEAALIATVNRNLGLSGDEPPPDRGAVLSRLSVITGGAGG